jgi:trimeric autotransporter adhesin
MVNNTTGGSNTASGVEALYSNTAGFQNTASGFQALFFDTAGSNNTAVGVGALVGNFTGDSNTAVGGLANSIGSYNTVIGYDTDATTGTYTNGTALGSGAVLTASNSIVLGNGEITAIYAKVSTIGGISDRRRKKDIRALDTNLGLDFIEKLKPVSYRFNNGDDTERYGFIAQDLEQALPASLHGTIERSKPEHGLALIARQNDKDRTYRVAYGELFAPIVKALQEQQQEIAAERQQNADLRHALAGPGRRFQGRDCRSAPVNRGPERASQGAAHRRPVTARYRHFPPNHSEDQRRA